MLFQRSFLRLKKLLAFFAIITRHGAPRQLLSDRGTNYLSKLMLEISKIMNVQKLSTMAYHPQSDGLVEKDDKLKFLIKN